MGAHFNFAYKCFRSGFRFIKSNSSENIQQQGQNASKLTVSYKQNFVSFVC